MSEDTKETITSFVIGGALALTIWSPIIIGLHKYNPNSQENYKKSATIQYEDYQYYLSDLYILSRDGKDYICNLTPSASLPISLDFDQGTPRDNPNFNKPDTYYDIKTGNPVLQKGFEEAYGFEIKEMADYFPYSDYSTGDKHKRTVIDEGTFLTKMDEVTKKSGYTK